MNIKLLSALLLFAFIHVKFSWANPEMAKSESYVLLDDNKSNLHDNVVEAEELFEILCKDTVLNLNNSGFASLNPQDLLDIFPIPVDTMFLSQSEFDCSSIGDNIITVTLTDTAGITDQCFSTVTVIEPQAFITCSSGTTVNASPVDSCSAFVFVADPEWSSGCESGFIINNLTGINDASGIYPVGETIILWQLIINGGTNFTCQQSITVVDFINPIAACKNIVLEIDTIGIVAISGSDVDQGSTDNCGIDNMNVFPSSFSSADLGVNDVTLTVFDVSGNSSTCQSTVTVVFPFVMPDCLPANLYLDVTGNVVVNPESLLDFEPGFLETIDTLFVLPEEFSCNDVGNKAVTVFVIDSLSNTYQCQSQVTISDTIAPVITCPPNISIAAIPDTCTAFVEIFPAVAIDNCNVISLINNYNGSVDASGSYPTGENTVTFTATDQNGNNNSCSFTVTVIDTSISVDCNPDIIQNNDSGNCSAFVDVPPPTVTACSEELISITNNIIVGENASAVYPVGITTVIWTISGVGINPETCIQNVSVVDNESPTVVCDNFTLILDTLGEGTVNANDILVSVSENCGIAAINLDKTEFNVDDIGENTVTVTAEDLTGNTATCISTVLVVVSEPPTAICNNISVMLDESGIAEINAAEIGNGSSSDNGIAGMVSSPDVLSCDDIGINQITLTVTDIIGLSSTCIAEVTIVDTLSPAIVCKNAAMTETDFWDLAYVLKAIDGGMTDNCSISSYTLIRNSADENNNLPTASIRLIAGDLSGNKSGCNVNITILDQECNTAFSIYPNPADEEFNLINNGIAGKYSIEIINDLGMVVYNNSLQFHEKEKVNINSNQLRSGIYVVKLTNIDKLCSAVSRVVIR